MNEEKMFEELKKLSLCCGYVIDRIAKECNVNQNDVAKLFMELMHNILNKMESNKE